MKSHERRQESRLATDTPVTVTALGARGQAPMEGRLLDVSGSGVLLDVPLPLPCGAAVKIEGDNRLLLGEVCRSQPLGDRHRAGVKVRHSLGELARLDYLNRMLLGTRSETVREPVESE